MRDYHHIPRPKVEYHPHIQDLIERQEVRTNDRNYHRDREKRYQERMDEIKAAPWKQVKQFWCEQCREDFLAEGIKEVEIDWTNRTQYIAFYRAKCDKGHWCIRHITDTITDRFFYRSRKVARDRAIHFKDTVQSWETGFELLYGRKNKS